MNINFPILLAAALVPLVFGSLWYSPVMFAKAWVSSIGMNEEQARKGNMIVSMSILFVASFVIAFALQFMVIHQLHMFSILADQPGFKDNSHTGPVWEMYTNFMNTYGHEFRTFKHGALHGFLAGVFFALPLIGSTAVFEQRGFKYVGITAGFWIINLTLMGGIICQWA